MKKLLIVTVLLFFSMVGIPKVWAALVVPNEIQQPGTQPGEVGNLESPDKCDNCHGGYNQAVEPAFNWRGSMMANAGRDPIFWATLAVAEQDFDGSGDLCIRCHSTGGWYGGRSTPTDGSGLMAGDADGVDCDTCHKMTNTNNNELLGVMNPPFIANDGAGNGYYGSGMLSLWSGNEKLGPYSDAAAKHQFLQSAFHRDVSFCGSCHDVSNPAVGDLAHNNGAQSTADPVVASGVLGSPIDGKAAFNNFPYQYGIVERTFSEYFAGALSKTLVSSYATLPEDLKAGAIQAAHDSAKGNYADGTPRYYSCQTCHLPAVTGVGCNKNGVPTRTDLPLHDMTGGNYWMPDAILYQDSLGTLRLGGGLTSIQISAITAGKLRAPQQLNLAASLEVAGNSLKITNLTGHKLISGYPEGRRMWLNVKWYDSGDALLREDGKYDVVASVNGTPVKSIVNLADPNTKIYEAHYGMTQEWASQLLGLGYSSDLPLSFDRTSGAVNYTLGQLAAQQSGTDHETFHFVLNNTVVKDNRIPTYGMTYEEARKRNALPVPATQYGNPTAGDTYNYWDTIALNPPAGAAYAEIKLLYQPTSWEYIQFLYLANNGQNAFLVDEGVNLLNAWLNTGMAEPFVMASTNWGVPPPKPGAFTKLIPENGVTNKPTSLTLDWSDSTGASSYEYCYDTSDDDACTTWISSGTTSSANLNGLSNNTTYYWQVRAINDQGTTYADGSSADYWSLTTQAASQPPGAFSKVSPENGVTDQPNSLTLDWSDSAGASSYEYCYDTTDDDACTTWISTGTASSADLNGLSNDTTYYWQVRAINNQGTTYANGSTADYWSFSTHFLNVYLPLMLHEP
ncbi:MAG: multiheme c-type cytochrome [Anaerolineales bacterium]